MWTIVQYSLDHFIPTVKLTFAWLEASPFSALTHKPALLKSIFALSFWFKAKQPNHHNVNVLRDYPRISKIVPERMVVPSWNIFTFLQQASLLRKAKQKGWIDQSLNRTQNVMQERPSQCFSNTSSLWRGIINLISGLTFCFCKHCIRFLWTSTVNWPVGWYGHVS